jgi:hypothetical protein
MLQGIAVDVLLLLRQSSFHIGYDITRFVAECLGQPENYRRKRRGFEPSFNLAHISSVHTRLEAQFLLGETSIPAKSTDFLAE